MGSNRRRGTRNRFRIKKNYIIPFICVCITCLTVIISVSIIINLKQQIKIIDTNNGNGENIIQTLTDDNIVQINKLFSFLLSNIELDQELSQDMARYYLSIKYYLIDNEAKKLGKQYISEINEDVYRNLGYVYFDDYKDEYLYITKSDFVNTYSQLFDNEQINLDIYSQYYIRSLDSYVIPKNNLVYSNSEYRLKEINYEKDLYVVTLYEINMYKLYEKIDIEEINDYLQKPTIDDEFLTGKLLKVELKKQNDKFVFSKYKV